MAVSHNHEFAKELQGLSAEKIRSHVEGIVEDWAAKLKAGTNVSLAGRQVALSFDQALQCLDLREQQELYPLAALGECAHLPRSGGGGSFDVLALFHSTEALVFQFDCGHDRAAFALTLDSLAAEARKEKWHEDGCCESWANDTDCEELYRM